MKNILSNKYVSFSLILIVGIMLGWVFFHSDTSKKAENNKLTEVSTKSTIWTCAMHPQIKMPKPGKCPICGMELIPLHKEENTIDEDAIQMTKEAAQLANVLTSKVSIQNPVKDLRLYGKVQADERLLQSQVSYFSGRIEKLLVNFTGELVRKGQVLAIIYSPDLMTAQQELLETASLKMTQPSLYEASKEKLRQWKLSEKQIATIESSGKVKTNFEIYANTSGVVVAKRINTGDFIYSGTVLFDIANLSHLWVMFDAYESDLPYLALGQKVEFTLQATPGVNYSSKISYIDPVLDAVTRVAKVRIEISNSDNKLKPEMFVTGIVKAELNKYRNKLIIPKTAVLWTGKRSIVYVKMPNSDEPIFKMREIELGPELGNSYVVENGLMDGEEIVSQGAFSIDASAQLEGKPSMMNPSAKNPLTVATAHKNTESNSVSNAKKKSEAITINEKSKMVTTKRQIFKVSGKCDMCKDRIETAAKSVNGVMKADWNIEKQMLNIDFDPSKTNSDEIQKAIAKVGHDTEKYKAKDEVYNKLPECCLYRK
ncbi:MAG: efflux transporter periplasmic adaptor subunit [Bacteroidetes bacterium CG2_30_33_31]|nr:MAG: efflux transporter periplasmic adaptor subunit [Bacteroidetes bacterium CG2_30_33_31]